MPTRRSRSALDGQDQNAYLAEISSGLLGIDPDRKPLLDLFIDKGVERGRRKLERWLHVQREPCHPYEGITGSLLLVSSRLCCRVYIALTTGKRLDMPSTTSPPDADTAATPARPAKLLLRWRSVAI